jgi:cytidyltransferase-like protein
MHYGNKIAVFPGSFDPWTYGHQDVLNQIIEAFSTVHVVFATNPAKKNVVGGLDIQTKLSIAMHTASVAFSKKHCSIDYANYTLRIGNRRVLFISYAGLIPEYVQSANIPVASVVYIRGIRNQQDAVSELIWKEQIQALYAPPNTIPVWLVTAHPILTHASSSFVRTVLQQSQESSLYDLPISYYGRYAISISTHKPIQPIQDTYTVCLGWSVMCDCMHHVSAAIWQEGIDIINSWSAYSMQTCLQTYLGYTIPDNVIEHFMIYDPVLQKTCYTPMLLQLCQTQTCSVSVKFNNFIKEFLCL